jgi:hypothetical protein
MFKIYWENKRINVSHGSCQYYVPYKLIEMYVGNTNSAFSIIGDQTVQSEHSQSDIQRQKIKVLSGVSRLTEDNIV